jgi:transcriptional regulator with XRE-family HTH domain
VCSAESSGDPEALLRGTHDAVIATVSIPPAKFDVYGVGAYYSPQEDESVLMIGERLRALREEKRLSQAVVEERTGLLRCYISRVENGHTVPAIETLEKLTRALEVPLYQLFYEGEEPPKFAEPTKGNHADELWGHSGKDARLLIRLCEQLSRMDEDRRRLLMLMAQHLQKATPRRPVKPQES